MRCLISWLIELVKELGIESYKHMSHRITEWLKLGGTSVSLWSKHCAQAGPRRAARPGPHPGALEDLPGRSVLEETPL